MPGKFSPPPLVSDPHMHHGTCLTHVPWCMPGSLTSGFLWNRWRGKRTRHSRRMSNPQFCVSVKRSILSILCNSFEYWFPADKSYGCPIFKGAQWFVLIHWGRDKMDAISHTTFSNAFSWMKMREFRLRFYLSLFLRFKLTIFRHWFR